jgi:hypothetical protein
MDIETARIVVAVIAAVGAVVWVAGLQFLIGSARARSGQHASAEGDTGMVVDRHEGWIAGTTEVQGDPGTLASRAAATLAKGPPYLMTAVRILEKTDDHIRFEGASDIMPNQAAGLGFQRGELRFTPRGADRTRVEWLLEPASMRVLMWLGAGFLVAGLLAVVVGGWAVYTYFASSPDPALRWQSFQLFQAVHFLWPPFLFGSLYRRASRAAAAQFAALVSNLPYLEVS